MAKLRRESQHGLQGPQAAPTLEGRGADGKGLPGEPVQLSAAEMDCDERGASGSTHVESRRRLAAQQ